MFYRFLLIGALLFACSGCSETNPQASTSPRPVATLRPTIALPTPQPTSASDTGWVQGSAGLELRQVQATNDIQPATITIARLDPARVDLRVGYAPGNPQTLATWYTQTQPLLVVNGGFFDENFRATALTIIDGSADGVSYEGFGGMIGVENSGNVFIQPLRDQAYSSEQPVLQGMQSFPMLVFPGGASPMIEWEADRDRRTAVALDQQGRLLFIICSTASLSLNEFEDWLRTSDLGIDRALNLDGGASTGLYVDAGDAQLKIDAFSRLPLVLYAVAR